MANATPVTRYSLPSLAEMAPVRAAAERATAELGKLTYGRGSLGAMLHHHQANALGTVIHAAILEELAAAGYRKRRDGNHDFDLGRWDGELKTASGLDIISNNSLTKQRDHVRLLVAVNYAVNPRTGRIWVWLVRYGAMRPSDFRASSGGTQQRATLSSGVYGRMWAIGPVSTGRFPAGHVHGVGEVTLARFGNPTTVAELRAAYERAGRPSGRLVAAALTDAQLADAVGWGTFGKTIPGAVTAPERRASGVFALLRA